MALQSLPEVLAGFMSREHGGLSMEREPNILLMRLKSMGDVVFTLPAVHRLRESFPRSRITYWFPRRMRPCWRAFGTWMKSSR